MQLHDAVGINCKNGATTEGLRGPTIWAKGCMLEDFVLSDLT